MLDPQKAGSPDVSTFFQVSPTSALYSPRLAHIWLTALDERTLVFDNPQGGVTPQPVAVFPSRNAHFLVLTVREGAEGAVRDFLTDVAGIIRAVDFRATDERLTCVVGIGAVLWDRLFDAPRPASLRSFTPVVGRVHTAVSTPGDLLFHIRADRPDLCFELGRQIMDALSGCVDVADEVQGFKYFDNRDLLGFVDGTENPRNQAALEAALVGSDEAPLTGSSYVIVQKYIHDMTSWDSLSVEEQSQAMGRHKLSDIEIPDAEKADNAHVVLNTIEAPGGTELKIVRENMPFGRPGSEEYGTYYIGYASDPAVTERMLENMFIGDPPGNHDRILDFSTAVTGSLFFVPTIDFLDDPTDALEALRRQDPVARMKDEDRHEPGPTSASEYVNDGSLRIGSLKGADHE